MKEVKRIMVAAAAAVMALTAAGCSSSSSSSSSKSSSKVYKIGICQLVQHEALDAATKGFKEDDLAGRSGSPRSRPFGRRGYWLAAHPLRDSGNPGRDFDPICPLLYQLSHHHGHQFSYTWLISGLNVNESILVCSLIVIALVALMYWFFGTELGSSLRATGCNPEMNKAQGININRMKVLGLAIYNGLVAVAGALSSQYSGFADVNAGRGSIVIGLAAVIIGEVLGEAILGKKLNFSDHLAFVVIGGNGADKSTTLNAIAGVWPVDTGSIVIDGQDKT